MLRFAILKMVGENEEVALEYNENQILNRLQARVRENLSENETVIKRRWTKDEVKNALSKAFRELIAEFKEKTITLK